MFGQLTVLVFLGSAKDFAQPRKNPVDVCKREKKDFLDKQPKNLFGCLPGLAF